MDVEVVERKFNPLLERDEVEFEILHEGEPTPTFTDARKVLRAKLNCKAELIVVDSIYSHFGSSASTGFAKVYKDGEMLRRTEAKHILRKNFGTQQADEGGSKRAEESEEARAKEG